MAFFLRPKDQNLDRAHNHINAEAIGVVQDKEDEYLPTTGFDSTTDGQSGSPHFKDPKRREAEPGAPLPTGGAPKGHTGRGVRGWRGAVSRTVSSGFGRGTRAGQTGRRS